MSEDESIVKIMRIQSVESKTKCCFCDKRCIEVSSRHQWIIDYKQSPNWTWGNTREEYVCLTCGDKIVKEESEKKAKEDEKKRKLTKEQRELFIKQEVNNLFAENAKIREELDKKVKNEYLNANDCQRFFTLKTKITEILKEKDIENFENYFTVEIDFNLLKETLSSLDEFVKENASPRTQKIARDEMNWKTLQSKHPSKNFPKKARIKEVECHHKNIIPFDDNLTSFCCKYCWESESPRFLKRLKLFYLDKIRNEKNNHLNSSELNSLIDALKSGGFTNQKEIKQAYQSIEQELKKLVDNHKTSIITQKDKDINSNLNMNTTERERERESKFNNNHLIYWIIGIIGVSLIGLLGFLIIRKNK